MQPFASPEAKGCTARALRKNCALEGAVLMGSLGIGW
jgi:hypothetical protein